MSADDLRAVAAILRAGVPKRRDVQRWADELDAEADDLDHIEGRIR